MSAALAQGIAILALPFLRVGGESALRFDAAGMRLLAFGSVVWIDEFHLVLMLLLVLLGIFLGGTVVFGRVWCGWACGQTVLPLLATEASAILPPRLRDAGTRLFLLVLSALVSLSLVGYFVPPAEAVRGMFLSPVLPVLLLAGTALVYFFTGILGPRFCRSICPYAMLQNVLFDRDTLTVRFDEGRAADCFRCDLCVHRCPVGIDIREGLRRECIACAECIDACALMTFPRRVAPFIGYRGRLRRGKTAAFGGALLAATVLLAFTFSSRPPVALAAQYEGPLPDGGGGIYRLTLRNHRHEGVRLAADIAGGTILAGPRVVTVPPRARTTVRYVLRVLPEGGNSATLVFTGGGVRVRERVSPP